MSTRRRRQTVEVDETRGVLYDTDREDLKVKVYSGLYVNEAGDIDDDNADDDDDKVDSNDEEIDVDGSSIGNSSDNNVGQVSSVNIIDGGDVDDDDDDDNEVVFLGEVVRNGRAEV